MPAGPTVTACGLLAIACRFTKKTQTMTPYSPALHYQAYQALSDLTMPARRVARHLAPWLHHSLFWFPESRTLRKAAAAVKPGGTLLVVSRWGHALSAFDATAAGFALLNFFVEDFGQILAAPFHQIIRVGDNAYAGDIVFQRDVPEPTVAADFGAQHQRCAAIQIRFAMRAFEIRIQHRFFQFRIALPPTKLVRQHRGLSGRIHDDFGMEGLQRTIRHLRLDPDSLIAIKQDLLDLCFLMNRRALFRSVCDQHQVEFRSCHLPGDSAFVMVGFEEIERARFFARRVGERHAVFAREGTRLQLL